MREGVIRVPPELVRSTHLAKYVITNDKGQNLGQAETFLVDLCTWKVPFVIASFGEIEGIEDKWYAIPFELVTFKTEKKEFIISVPRDVIKKARGIPRNIWGPDRIDLRWLSEACHYYGCVPYWEV
jgi:hypothetical protein